MESFFGLNPYFIHQPPPLTPIEKKQKEMPEFLSIVADRYKLGRYTEIGRGGEAVVYRLKTDTAAKVFLSPNDPCLADDPTQSKAAEERLVEMQTKLFDMPSDLPSNIVVPNGVIVDADKQIFGYTMPLVLVERTLSEVPKGNSNSLDLILQLYDMLIALHKTDTVIGDFNENNILVDYNRKIKIVDADSMQFGQYTCNTFIARFTPPEHLKVGYSNDISLVLKRNKTSDWYAFLVMAMRMLTNTDPFGGTVVTMDYDTGRPAQMSLGERIRNHITVFDKQIIYPVTAVPLRSLPRHILEVFFQAFHRKIRFIPDRSVFEPQRLSAKTVKTAQKVVRNLSARQAKRMKRLAMKSPVARKWFRGREFNGVNAEAAALAEFKRNVRI